MKNTFANLIYIILFVLFAKCASSDESNKGETEIIEDDPLAMAPETWIKGRTGKAKDRLTASEAGSLLWSSIEAHGGLADWFGKGPIDFHFDYQPTDGGKRRNSFQRIDQWSVRAVHEVADNREIKYGWDGKQAWSFPDSANVGVNPRFWSTTPFYFVGLPFVLADEGVILESLGRKEFKGTTYDLIKASFESGIGDAPDDFYVLYIHPVTKLVSALRYIVSYPGFFPDGGHLPEKFMEIRGHQVVDGITLPLGYQTFWFKNEEPAEHITTIDVSEVSFKPATKSSFFFMPKGARVQQGF